jgi:hypothetical protein
LVSDWLTGGEGGGLWSCKAKTPNAKSTHVCLNVSDWLTANCEMEEVTSLTSEIRMTFRQNFFFQDWFRNKLGVGLALGLWLGLVFGIGLVLVKPLLCYVLRREGPWPLSLVFVFKLISTFNSQNPKLFFMHVLTNDVLFL